MPLHTQTPQSLHNRSMRRHFQAAPWSIGLKLTSTLGTIIVVAVGFAAYRAIPTPAGFTHLFGLGVALVLPNILVASLVFMVTGYTVAESELYVERLLWSTRISLAGLSRVWFEPAACKGSIRVFGNGGLFSFTGLYRSRALGRYRLFATNISQSVVLVLPQRVVLVTPAAPQAFIEHLCHLFPTAHVGPKDGGA